MLTKNLSLALALALALATPALAQSGRARRVNPRPAPAPAEQPADDTSPAPETEPEPEPVDAGPAATQPAAEAPPARKPPTNAVAKVGAKYQGGSLPIEIDTKVTVEIKNGVLSISSKGDSIQVPADKVLRITYSQATRTRTAEGVGIGVLNPTAGTIIGNSRTTDHYVEIVWAASPDGGAVLKVGKNDYRGLLVALEAATGLEAKIEPEPPIRDWKLDGLRAGTR